MLFKMKWMACTLVLATAYFAQAQEKAAQPATSQNQPTGTQTGNAQSQNERQSQTGENQNRRRDNADKANENRNRTEEARSEQNRDPNRRESTVRTETRDYRTGSSSDKPLDAQLATCLLIGNQEEVALSQWAAERTKNEKVKAFAKQMVKDHSQAVTMLQRFAGPDASKELSIEQSNINRSETTVNRTTTSTDSNRSPEGQRRDASSTSPNRDATRPGDATARSATETSSQVTDRNASEERNRATASVQVRSEQEAMPDKMLAIQREVAQKCLAMSKQELEQSSNFDQAYVGMQISAHVGMIAKLETFKSYASEDLGKVIQESLDTAQGHLRHAKELVMELSQNSGSSTSTRSDASSRSDASNRNESNRDATRNPANRDDATRREGAAFKKDAPKS